MASLLKKFLGVKETIESRPEEPELPQQPEKRQKLDEKHGLVPLPQPAKIYKPKQNLPLRWLSEPEYVDPQAHASFSQLGVSPKIIANLQLMQINDAFAIQAAVIPGIIFDHKNLGPEPLPDVLVNSYTGSGKTLAYCVPIVEVLHTRRVPRIRALLVLPTRPLIQQLVAVLEQLCKGTGLSAFALRADRPLQKESLLLKAASPDILVATPGRLVDHLVESRDLLKDLEFVVFDEADRLLSQSFQDFGRVLSACLPLQDAPVHFGTWKRPPQRMVFSATLTRNPGKLAELNITALPRPPRVYVVSGTEEDRESREFFVPDGLDETLLRAPSLELKPLALVHQLLEAKILARAIIFVRSNEAAARLAGLVPLIAKHVYGVELKCSTCSGEMPPTERKRALRTFAAQETAYLVCTDLIARGIDVKDVACVVNYDLPLGAREYIHRVGRTARAGARGRAWALSVSSAERKHFWTMQSEISRLNKITVRLVQPEKTEGYQTALAELEAQVRS